MSLNAIGLREEHTFLYTSRQDSSVSYNSVLIWSHTFLEEPTIEIKLLEWECKKSFNLFYDAFDEILLPFEKFSW